MQHAQQTIRQRASWLALAVCLIAVPSAAFPGVCVGKGNTSRVVHTTYVVLMLKDAVSVVTIMPDYQGPLDRFALLIPVPSDVTRARIKTVKRNVVSRVEQLSAPRYHAFYEKDPCRPGPAEQDWEHKFEVQGLGALAAGIPPADRTDKVPKELVVPIDPEFKRDDGEFSYRLVEARDRPELDAWLSAQGYAAPSHVREALAARLAAGAQLLVAEVDLDQVELSGESRVQLGGIRYWTKQPTLTVASTLGLANASSVQDSFIFVLHPTQRFRAKNYRNWNPPSNVRVAPKAGERVAQLYNAIHDRVLSKHPQTVATEYVWPTDGCGEPCPNAPLQLRELMTLGGDVLEAETVSAADRAPPVPPETEAESAAFAQELEQLDPAERIRARARHGRDRRELARRRALIERQRYILTRLHHRYRAQSLPHDLELVAAARHLEGGVGIPKGSLAALELGTSPARSSRFQVRFTHAFAWEGDGSCPHAKRWRWGRRWQRLGHRVRKVWVGRNLPDAKRDQALAAKSIQSRLPDLGFGLPAPVDEADRPPPAKRDSTCRCAYPAVSPPALPTSAGLAWLVWVVWLLRRSTHHCARRS